MKKPKKPAKKKAPEKKITAPGKPGGDSVKEKTTPPGGKVKPKKPKPASAKKPGHGVKAAGQPGGNGQSGKTTVPHIIAIGGTGGDSQKEGTKVPRDKAAQETRDKLRQGILEHARRVKGSVYVSRDDIVKIIDDKLGGLWKKNVDRFAFIGDTDYYCPPFDEVERMIGKPEERLQYHPEIFDCDDFSYELKGAFTRRAFENGRERPFSFALGIVWLDRPFPHAMNWVISWGNGNRAARTLYLVEPQTGEIFDIDGKTGVLRRIILRDLPPEEGRSYRNYEIVHGDIVGKPHRDIYLTLM